ncbi:MAG: prephenate dehydratase [Bacteroidales bacterium]|nr:prephenate dehydratase [Bacteroidales bacterium]MBN2762223.1 prephenate dehydratase [Bacteroidales bacterium]
MDEIEIKPKRIAIQGGYGAFHEIAALNYFENEEVEIIPRNTFKDLFQALKQGLVDYGITAIENSIAGSILPNYSLLLESNLSIIGEIYLRIVQNLVAMPGQTIENIREVYSHPMAILQCQRFFDEYPHIKLIDSVDTALSAKEIAEKKIMGTAAISSRNAANRYSLSIIAENIETHKMNYTRFLILKGKNGDNLSPAVANKASLTFALAHKIGCLSKVLSILSYYNINLAKIQSMPIIGKDWEYQFYVDVEIDDYSLYLQAIEAIKPFTSHLHILGEYLKGKAILE